MPGFSNATEAKILDHIVGKSQYAFPTNTYLALCTTAPSETDTGSTLAEPTGLTGYARKVLTAADWNAASGGQIANAATITFATITAGTATILGWALCTAASGGDVIAYGGGLNVGLSATQTPATVAPGALTISLD